MIQGPDAHPGPAEPDLQVLPEEGERRGGLARIPDSFLGEVEEATPILRVPTPLKGGGLDPKVLESAVAWVCDLTSLHPRIRLLPQPHLRPGIP